MAKVNIYEAKTGFSRLIDRALAGEEIIVARAGRPLVRLVPVREPARGRVPGTLRDRIEISPDFDEPLPPDLLAAFHDDPVDPD